MSARAAPAYGSNKCICPVLGCQAAFPQLPILRYHCTVIHDSDRVLLPCFSFRNVTQCPVCFQIRATQGSTHNCLGSSEARLASARDKQIQQTDHLAFLVWSNSILLFWVFSNDSYFHTIPPIFFFSIPLLGWI